MARKNKKKRYIIIATIVVIISLLCALGYFHIFKNAKRASNNSTKSKTTASSSYNSTNITIKESGTDKPNQPTQIEGSNLKKVPVAITSSDQTDSTIQIRAIVYVLDSGGTCTLKLERIGYSTIAQTASLQNSATTSTCKGFNISKSEISAGDWDMTISYLSDTLTGSATQTLIVK